MSCFRCEQDNPEVHTVLEMGYGQQELATAVAAEGLRSARWCWGVACTCARFKPDLNNCYE